MGLHLALDFEFLTLGVQLWALDFELEILHLEFWTSVLHFGRWTLTFLKFRCWTLDFGLWAFCSILEFRFWTLAFCRKLWTLVFGFWTQVFRLQV